METSNNRATTFTTSRMMVGADANLAGNVHGGTILRMIEEAGFIVSRRHVLAARKHAETSSNLCGSDDVGEGASDLQSPATILLARIEHMNFKAPMHIGEVSRLKAQVVFASGRSSLEVLVHVSSENLDTGLIRETNECRLWYVAVDSKNLSPINIPLLPLANSGGERRYKQLKLMRGVRSKAGESPDPEKTKVAAEDHRTIEVEGGRSPADSVVSLCQIVSRQDCTSGGYLLGGVVMKIMDTAAGLVAYRHCQTNVVTACIDALDFHTPVFAGELLHTRAIATFSSSRSLEILVQVDVEAGFANVRAPGKPGDRRHALSGIFTFVSLDIHGKTQPIMPLSPHSMLEQTRYRQGQARYTKRKMLRQTRARIKTDST